MAEETEIQSFYKGCNVFVTGGTGFMGKILIEKLLRSTDVATIYVLIRDKKGKKAHVRVDEMLDDVIFEKVKQERPKFKHKVEAIQGDCSVSGLGLTITDRQKLIANINIVFHMAATVRFDEEIKFAYDINVNGTNGLLQLCKEIKNLKSIIHVSTAYSHCYQNDIDEKFYQTKDYEQVREMLNKLTKEEIEEITPRLIHPWPNTYSFTKALAETLIRNIANDLPIGIFRPGIVVSTYKEPIPGWADNFYGPTGVCVGTMSGLLRVMKSDIEKKGELVPVDTCAAGLIAAAWDVGTRETDRTPENITIYNYVSTPENPVTWDEFISLNLKISHRYPSETGLWVNYVLSVKNARLFWFYKLIYHIIPGILIDIGLVVTGNSPRILKVYEKIHKIIDVLAYFSTKEWNYTNNNTQKLWKKLSNEDKELFPLSMKNVHWLQYYNNYTWGLRKYVLREPDSSLEKSRKRYKRLFIYDKLLKVVLQYVVISLLMWIIYKIFAVFFS